MYVSTKYCFSRIGGRRCIVPVLLEDFNDDQVSIISNLTFVNAVGSAAFDVSSRIAESVACSDLYATMFPGECTNVFSRFENGYSVELPLQRDNIRFNRPAKYRFRIDRDVLTLLTDSHMKVPDGLLKDVVKFVNKEAIMKSYYFLMKRNICCWVFFLLPPMLMLLGALVYFIVIVSTCTQERPDNETPHFDLDGVLGMLGVALGETYIAILIAMVCAVPKLCHREKRDIDLQVKIYSRFSRRCIKMTSLLSSADGKTVDQVFA
ncbi:uncharacterized protein LOC128550184 [Mercenaria mercenaria]|uniref:uncharacterized protein LOC128550184 n=1 Tax=Mercenaria mercenaria TaxID=6596 RepID=UPI00234EEA78|nr:uncharacterized protein LOC128550184 [Mercenaria mercenaria]